MNEKIAGNIIGVSPQEYCLSSNLRLLFVPSPCHNIKKWTKTVIEEERIISRQNNDVVDEVKGGEYTVKVLSDCIIFFRSN